MRVVVDFELCELNALCTVEAPSVFRIVNRDGVDELEVVIADPPDEFADHVRAAADACPKAAITLEAS